MKDLNFSSLLDQFCAEQQEDLALFEKIIEDKAISAKLIEHIQRRVYVRRKFLAQLRSCGTFSVSSEERDALLQKIQNVLQVEGCLRQTLERVLTVLREKQDLLRKGRQALRAYRWSSSRQHK